MTLMQSNFFRYDPWGWAGNQGAHCVIGIVLAFASCLSFWAVVGEYPYKIHVFLFLLIGFFAFEIATQGWNSWDTLEDTFFVVFYGAGTFLTIASEVTPGSSMVLVDMEKATPFVAMFACHMVIGMVWRTYNEMVRRNE